MAIKWTIVSRKDAVLKKMGSSVDTTAQSIKTMLVEAVQEKILYGYKDVHGNPPHTEIVDTGALFDDVTATVEKVSQNAVALSVGNTDKIRYAGYIHDGTSKLKGRPYVKDAIEENEDKIEATTKTGIASGMK